MAKGGNEMDKKIMIVDDELDILDSLKLVFEREDYDVVTVDSGKKCLKELEKGFKGVILMDIMMPNLDGWDTIKEIVSQGLIRNVEIEIITGKGTRDHQKMGGFGSYIYDYLAKPLNVKELVESVKKCSAYLHARTN